MGWVSWPLHIFVFLASFSVLCWAQGFRKSFKAWGLNFKQFSAGINFEIVGHGYDRNKHVQRRCTSELKVWESNQKEMTNMKQMIFWKKIFIFFFKSKYIFAAFIRCFQHGSPLLLGNKGSMQAGYTMGPLWYQLNAGKHKSLNKKSQEKKSTLIHFISLLEWAKVWHSYIHLFFNYSYNLGKRWVNFAELFLFGQFGNSEITHFWIQSVSAWFNCPHQLRL